MADRKAELERKKERLRAMREEKKRKEEEKKKKDILGEASSSEASLSSQQGVDVESLLNDLDIPATSTHSQDKDKEQAANDKSNEKPTSEESQPLLIQSKVKLTLVNSVTQTNIPPKEMVTYSKEVQTTEKPIFLHPDRKDIGSDDFYDGDDVTDGESNYVVEEYDNKEPHSPVKKREAEVEEKVVVPKELTDEEKMKMESSEDFLKWFDRATRIVERAMTEPDDLFFIDYTGRMGEDRDMDQNLELLKVHREFVDERWSKNRTVTCLDWSETFPELCMASYNANEGAPNDPDGVVLIWNMRFKKDTPEYVFHCQSPIVSSCFATFYPYLVIGGTYSGQIVMWDNRETRRTPVHRTPLSNVAHTHPVYCVKVIGSQHAHNLISVSTDGKLCSWSLDMFSKPQETIELTYKQSKQAAAMCYSFFSNDLNNFVVGSEDGVVYSANRHSSSKSVIGDLFEGHLGPVTGIDCHSASGLIDFSHLFLSSSFDWSIKLWSAKEPGLCLQSFEDNADYVMDVNWSPVHPAVFAAVDTTGRLDLWNINMNTEIPITSYVADPNTGINKCRWHQSGHHIATGNDNGVVHLFDVGEQISNPRSDEWTKLLQTEQELRVNALEKKEAIAQDSNPGGLGSNLLSGRNTLGITSPLR